MYKKLFCRVFATQHVTCQSQEEAELVPASEEGRRELGKMSSLALALLNEQHVNHVTAEKNGISQQSNQASQDKHVKCSASRIVISDY